MVLFVVYSEHESIRNLSGQSHLWMTLGFILKHRKGGQNLKPEGLRHSVSVNERDSRKTVKFQAVEKVEKW